MIGRQPGEEEKYRLCEDWLVKIQWWKEGENYCLLGHKSFPHKLHSFTDPFCRAGLEVYSGFTRQGFVSGGP